MTESIQVKEAFQQATTFLRPINNSQGKSLLEVLIQNTTQSVSPNDEEAARTLIIGTALDILSRIHAAFVAPVDARNQYLATEGEDTALEDAKRRRMLHALLDLISLEGIYPSLSSGVGIPLQQRVISVLPAGVIAKQANITASSTPRNVALLHRTIKILLKIMLDSRSSIQPVIGGRILSDIISGTADLAFNPNIDLQNDRIILQDQFSMMINDQISQIPLRPGGVLQTILFIASQFSPSLGQEAQSEQSNGPHFTVQAIMQISKLLSSVPQGVDPVLYFTTIAPQLLSLLDGNDPDLKKTASYTIGNGILGKRMFGAPGTIGHSIFLEPIFRTLTADLDDPSSRWMKPHSNSENQDQSMGGQSIYPNTIVESAMIQLALDRLGSLALQHPNPGLVKRIVSPILLPLWGLACYSQEQNLDSLHQRIMTLLGTYFSISVGLPPLKKLGDNLLWDGGSTWTYRPNFDGSISIVQRTSQMNQQLNMIHLMNSLEARTDLFVGLLGSDPRSEELTGDMFLYVSQKWLMQPNQDEQGQLIGESDNLSQKLVSAKITEKLLNNFKDTLSRHPLRVLDLIKQVIDGELHRGKSAQHRKQNSQKPSLSSLANIVSPEAEGDHIETSKETSESLSTAFSLLSTVLASPEFSTSQETKSLLVSVKESLDKLIGILPDDLCKPATTASMLLEIQLGPSEEGDNKPTPTHFADIETHCQALSNLNSDLPPVQAEGFSLLTKLVNDSSPVLDIPSTLTLLLSIITDISESTANEEYIYLNAIKLIGTLASRHPKTVIKTLVDSYADKNEHRTLDQRLKIGESLLRAVQDLGEALNGETAKILGEGMVAVAGRRGIKSQAQATRKEREKKERRRQEQDFQKNKEEPVIPEDDDSDTETPEHSAHAANIVAAWAAGAASDQEPDDLRVRTSALSILASAMTTNILGLGSGVVSSSLDLALATLTLEPGPESAILRRASVILIMDALKALDKAREERKGRDIGIGFSLIDTGYTELYGGSSSQRSEQGPGTIGNIPIILRTLGFVESREDDPIVRGHLRALVESLEAWIEKSLMWGIGCQDHGKPRMELSDQIAGLDIDPLSHHGSSRPRIEEIE
ncbi:hypothetical protein N7478_012993 [Penicillium angulare]|uniref:uncharacterized protein n=1 Tax=Penicillium angulare TaxID=116970 RepID=UPI002540402A|nr:uncharacterized protein N7478_012993 [Penicillium angulare]KAJ5256889.1 hypothetical protein N7478_012993 [Penicillium angulare]